VASFYKDPYGIVHLQGSANNAGAVTGVIFTLPAGYRPAAPLYFAVFGAAGTAAYVAVGNNGTVSEVDVAQSFVSLSNVTFRAGL
jgi:hypothetical protein